MSLLNDMLRDLSHDTVSPVPQNYEHNLAGHARVQEEQRELFAQSSAAKPLPRTLLPSIIVFIVVLVGVLGWRYFGYGKTTAFTTVAITDIPAQIHTEEIKTPAENADTPAVAIALPDASPELGERLAALETAVTSLADVLANKQEHIPAQSNPPETVASISIAEPFVASPLEHRDEDAGDTALFIAPNSAWQDQQSAAQARELFNAGQVGQSIVRLQNFIAGDATAYESTRLLLDIFCEQENSVAAQQLLTQADFLAPEVKNYYAAKIALLQGNPAEAVALLEASFAQAETDENYRALLAGLYQRSGMNEEAASHYRRLLSVFGEKPAYWLGFALAQDALNQSQLALQAYQRVSQYSDLQPPVRQYVEQRLAALQQ